MARADREPPDFGRKEGIFMEIERIDTYRDGRFSQRVLCQHGC